MKAMAKIILVHFKKKDIKDTLDIDNLGLVDMVALVESLFGIKIQAHEMPSILTFGNLYDYI
jgi:acyl carrier protein